jgi:hypothetical protein
LKKAGFLVAALSLLSLAAWLMIEPETPRAPRAALSFPRVPRQHEIERQERRRTLALPAPTRSESGGEAREATPSAPPAPPADPVHVALPASEAALVVEAGVLKGSPLGRMLLACLSPGQTANLRELEQRTGLRPLEQLDRIAVSGGTPESGPVLVLSGRLDGVDLRAFDADATVDAVGDKTTIAATAARAVAVWDGQILLLGEPSGVRAAVARLEGEVPVPPSDLASEAYGEIYGSVPAEALSRMLPSELGERLRVAAERVVLHVDATDDLLLVADVYGRRDEELADLGTAVAGALSIGRLQAASEGNAVLSDLLDESRVIPGSGSFQLEMALPLETLARQLGACAQMGP